MTDPRGPRGAGRPVAPAPDAGRSHDLSAASAGLDELHLSTEAVLAASRALLGVMAVSLLPALERVTLPQLRALVLLSGTGPTRIGVLARRLGVHQSTFTRTTDRMVEAGIVRRVENPDNRREVIVEATEAGLAYVREVSERRRYEVEQILARMGGAERRLVQLGLEAFARSAGEPSVETLAVLGG